VKSLISEQASKMTSGRVTDGAPAPVVTPAVTPEVKVTPAAAVVTATPSKVVTPPDSLFGKKEPVQVTPAAPAVDPDLPTDAAIATMNPSAAKAAKAMRARIEVQNAKIAELEKRPVTADNTEKLTALEKSNQELQDLVDRVALEQSPRFKDRFEIPKQKAIAEAEGYLLAGETDPARIKELKDVIQQAIGLPLKDRIALIKEHAEDLQSLVIPALAKIDQLDQMRSSELAKSADARKADQIAHEQQVSQFKEKVFGDTLQKAIAGNHFVFQEVEGSPEWNKIVGDTRSLAKQLFDSNDPEAQAAGLMLGAAAPVYLNLYNAEKTERIRLQGEIAKYQKAMPRIGGGQPPADEGAGNNAPKDGRMTAKDAAGAVLAKLGIT
jgi:hypothetical protein